MGDFLQLPPVVRGSASVHYAFESAAWKNCAFETIELTHVHRTDDKDFIELLHHVRFGRVDEAVHNALNGFIKPLPNDFSQFTFLFAKNNSAARHNKEQLAHIESELVIKEAQIIKQSKSVSDKEIERFMEDARIERELELKIGAPVLFSRNAWNYFNGERGEIVNIDAAYVYVQKSDGKVVKLEQVAQSKSVWKEKTLDGKKELQEEEIFRIYQYPIKLAFAITIHKSQGMSIEDLIIDTQEIFAPSQFYVALSRACNPKRLTLIAPKRQWYALAFVNKKAMEFVKKGSTC
ncbi:Putative helicase [hydrothermal vent metagenome]|uniref:Putative helicase n=1 Tax=hydrothermal vent metagenome TaxID=652676 RepID=A0A1W1BPV5_9ZZZZ